MAVEEHLRSRGEAMLVDQTLGQRHLIYPTRHRLTNEAERIGRGHLIAAWLYLHFRGGLNTDPDEGLSSRYEALTDRLMSLLEQTGEAADASFLDRMDEWLTDASGEAGQQMGREHG